MTYLKEVSKFHADYYKKSKGHSEPQVVFKANIGSYLLSIYHTIFTLNSNGATVCPWTAFVITSNRERENDAERSSETCPKISGAEILHRLIITCLTISLLRLF